MKHLSCEMCGSSNLVKQDGVFVCQVCGAKYSVEDAKKMMTEETREDTIKTVKVDTSDELENSYQIARRAKDDNNCENAAKYYDMILIKDPTSWEAYFYVIYFKAMVCKVAQIQSSCISVSNCIYTVLCLIKDYVNSRAEQVKAVQEVALRCSLISGILYNAAANHYYQLGIIRKQFTQEMVNTCCSARDIMYVLGDNIDMLFSDYQELQTCSASAWKEGINKHCDLLKYFPQKNVNMSAISDYACKVQKYEPSYSEPKRKSSVGGCYIATAVYGSYDCPQVWTLRRFRDNTLSKTWYGRAFISIYYSISPILVELFGENLWFKKVWKNKLDKLVKKLQLDGIESTPYED